MALVNSLERSATEKALAEWLSDRISGGTEVEVSDLVIPQSAGMSMTTVLFTARWKQDGSLRSQDLVARVAPQAPGVFKRPDLAREFRLLGALIATAVPVPTPYWLEENPTVLGAPFMIVQRVDGRVPADDPPYTVEGWVLDLDPDGRSKIFDGALDVLRHVHAVDWRGLGLLEVLDEPEFGPTGIGQRIAHWEDSNEWAAAEAVRSPTIDAGLAWMKANRPADDTLVLNWGDPRPGNIIYGDDLEVKAALDWEMACIGSPQADVGWMAFMIRYFTEGVGAQLPDGMPTREQVISRYEELTGNRTPDVDFYEAFAALQLAITYLRVGNLMIAAGKLPGDTIIAVNNPCSQLLSKLTGAPPPPGEVENYVGSR